MMIINMTAKTFSLSTGTVQGRRSAGRTPKGRVARRAGPQGDLLRPGATAGSTRISSGLAGRWLPAAAIDACSAAEAVGKTTERSGW